MLPHPQENGRALGWRREFGDAMAAVTLRRLPARSTIDGRG
jgi:hypothetical protein